MARSTKAVQTEQEVAKRSEAEKSSKSSVQSLAKAFRLLETIAATETELTLSELSVAAALDPGTTHRMLNTLIDLGYVEKLEGKRFGLTLKVLDLGFRAIGRRDMRALARPLLRTLVGEVSEAASLGVLEGADVLYVERIRAGITRLGVDIRIGTMIPAASSVIGWAMLAFLPDAECARILGREPQPGFAMPPTLEDLRAQLAAIRSQGYALSPSHISNGLAVLAAPVRDEDGYPLAAVSVAAPSVRMDLEDLKARALGPLQNVARELARGLQASGGTVAG